MFSMRRAGITISTVCNLKCKLCAAYSPYISDKKMLPLIILNEYIRRYFNIVDHVETFTIAGGEPLLYKDLPLLIDELLNYTDKFNTLEIISNGTIIPQDDLLSSIKQHKDKFRFIISNYGSGLSIKANDTKAVLEKNNINTRVVNYFGNDLHCGGWVDFGNVTELIHSESEAQRLFLKCAYPQVLHYCFTIYDGCITPCPGVFRRVSLGTADKSEYVDLMDDYMTVEQQQDKIMSIYNAKWLKSCLYCKGMCDDSPRYKPAEQLKNV